jgi:hypothetical protein
MLDKFKCKVCYKIAKSWWGKPWELLVKLYRQSKSFRQQWDEAYTNFNNGTTSATFEIPTSVRVLSQRRDSTEKLYFFLTVSQFVSRYNMQPKSIGLKLSTYRDEFGVRDLKGVLVQPTNNSDDMAMYRQVRVIHETVWNVDEQLRAPADRLRKAEPQDIFNGISLSKSKERKDRICAFGAA